MNIKNQAKRFLRRMSFEINQKAPLFCVSMISKAKYGSKLLKILNFKNIKKLTKFQHHSE